MSVAMLLSCVKLKKKAQVKGQLRKKTQEWRTPSIHGCGQSPPRVRRSGGNIQRGHRIDDSDSRGFVDRAFESAIAFDEYYEGEDVS